MMIRFNFVWNVLCSRCITEENWISCILDHNSQNRTIHVLFTALINQFKYIASVKIDHCIIENFCVSTDIFKDQRKTFFFLNVNHA